MQEKIDLCILYPVGKLLFSQKSRWLLFPQHRYFVTNFLASHLKYLGTNLSGAQGCLKVCQRVTDKFVYLWLGWLLSTRGHLWRYRKLECFIKFSIVFSRDLDLLF